MSNTFRDLPPFSSLIAFEAAARLMSFKKAADELFLTPPAITYRIKELESLLCIQLFVRTPSGISLSPAGKQYYEEIHYTLGQLQRATQSLSETHAEQQLRVQMLPFMAIEVVIPHLADFYKQHPDISIQIDTKYSLADFDRDDVDLSIRFGLGDWPGVIATKLMSVSAAPVCSAQYAQEYEIESIEDLNRCTLISLLDDERNWDFFCDGLDVPRIQAQRELQFSDYVMALRAAEKHSGVSFGILPMINFWLEAGRLVRPLDIELKLPYGYFLLHREQDADRPDIEAFSAWLKTILPTD